MANNMLPPLPYTAEDRARLAEAFRAYVAASVNLRVDALADAQREQAAFASQLEDRWPYGAAGDDWLATEELRRRRRDASGQW